MPRRASSKANCFPGNRTLAAFFEQVYRPIKLHGKGTDYVSQYRSAIRWLRSALGRDPTLDDLHAEAIRQMLEAAADLGDRRRSQLRQRIASLWRYAHQLGLAQRYKVVLLDPARPRGRRPDELPEPAEGTVRHFFETVYRPQKLLGCSACQVREVRFALRRLRVHYGRDIRLDEQTDALAADHFQWFLEQGVRATTINAHRAAWFAVWRFACEQNLVEREPKVRKLPEEIDEPDAWSQAEAERLLAAADVLKLDVDGIPEALFFRALLRVGWWTGLRRSSLLKIKRSDVDLATGWLTVYGSGMKNRRGKRFRIGDDAIAAVRRIWLPDRELLFPWPYNVSTFSRRFRRILAAAGLPPSTRRVMTQMHKWRRTVATIAASTAGLGAASALLGHSSTEMTRRYLDPTKLPGNDATQFLPFLTD